MPKENNDQSLENFEFNDEPEFFGVKAGKTLTGAKELASKNASLEDEDTFFKFDEDDGGTTALDDAEALDKKQKAAESKKKASGAGTTKTKNQKDEDGEDEDDDEDLKDEDDEEEEETKPKKKKVTKKDEEDEDEDEDEDGDEDDKTVKAKNKNKAKDEDVSEEEQEVEFYTELANEFKELNVFQNVKIKKGEKITRERWGELHDEEIEARVQDTIEAMSEKMDEDGKRFLAFAIKGGKTSDFLAVLSNRVDIGKLDPKKDKDVDKIITHHLRTVEKMDEEEVAERLQYLTEKGTKETFAAKYHETHKKNQEAREAALNKQAEENEKAEKQANKIFSEELTELLDKTEKVGSFPIGKTEKKAIKEFITRPVVKMGKVYVPEINAEINRILTGERPVDKKQLIALAKIIRSKFKVDDLEAETETRVVKKTKSKLMAARQGHPKAASSGAYSKRDLASSFADDDWS